MLHVQSIIALLAPAHPLALLVVPLRPLRSPLPPASDPPPPLSTAQAKKKEAAEAAKRKAEKEAALAKAAAAQKPVAPPKPAATASKAPAAKPGAKAAAPAKKAAPSAVRATAIRVGRERGRGASRWQALETGQSGHIGWRQSGSCMGPRSPLLAVAALADVVCGRVWLCRLTRRLRTPRRGPRRPRRRYAPITRAQPLDLVM